MNKKFWTLRYTLINMTYFAVFCSIHAYSSVFLLDKGFTNTQIGILLAVANILSLFAQFFFAGIIDKGAISNRMFSVISALIIIAGAFALIFIKSSFIGVFIIFALIYMLQMAYQPMMIDLNFEYAKAGCNINFGFARGMGSAGFAITSIFIGNAVASAGVNLLMIVSIVSLLAHVVLLLTFKKPDITDGKITASQSSSNPATTNRLSDDDSVSMESNEIERSSFSPDETSMDEESDVSVEEKPRNNIFEFIKAYPYFMIMILGTVCVFYGHNSLNDFMIQIVRFLGGNESQMGYATFLQAILELPMMAMSAFLVKKFGTGKLLIVSAVFFTIKIGLLAIANSISLLFVSQAMQFFAYALFIPVAAYFVTEVLSPVDRVKGQAFVNCGITAAGIFSNLISGRVLDFAGCRVMLTIGVIISVLGIVLIVISTSAYKDRLVKKR